MTADPLAKLETSIGHQFADRNILHEALSHSSCTDSKHSYERLEFLGDRVLGLLLADHFYAAFPQDNEGALSLRLHGEARKSTLTTVAKNLKLADYIKSQSGLDLAGTDGVMADVVESLMAAIDLDAGSEAAREFLHRQWSLNSRADAQNEKDAKSKLQEWSLQHGLGLPAYRQLTKSGPDHAPQMTYEVKIEGYEAVVATAGSRKVAEQTAAASLLELLQERTLGP